MIINTNHFSDDDNWDEIDEEEDEDKLGKENWGDSLENDDDDPVN